MATKTKDLKDIMATLDSLQSRVRELSDDEAVANDPPAAAPAPEEAADQNDLAHAQMTGPTIAPLPGAGTEVSVESMSLLRAGIAELSTMNQFKDFPQYFVRLCGRTGLRMLLLKRWTTGLQVFLEENIKLPPEAKRKRSDGRAPIPTTKTDIFEATAAEAAVYSGPVPVKHFPLDLTLMLGRGSRDRQVIVVPLPSQGHWNTFLYLDADKATAKNLAVAEIRLSAQ